MNNLALWPGSIVVIDPKGENGFGRGGAAGDGSALSLGLGQKV